MIIIEATPSVIFHEATARVKTNDENNTDKQSESIVHQERDLKSMAAKIVKNIRTKRKE